MAMFNLKESLIGDGPEKFYAAVLSLGIFSDQCRRHDDDNRSDVPKTIIWLSDMLFGKISECHRCYGNFILFYYDYEMEFNEYFSAICDAICEEYYSSDRLEITVGVVSRIFSGKNNDESADAPGISSAFKMIAKNCSDYCGFVKGEDHRDDKLVFRKIIENK